MSASAAWKTVRVFISSTFRDMHAERDYLVKRVFPALREQLEKYRIHLIDIDLRWGITEEEAEKDQVLDLCLQQIDECRPFFIGILGERYGWVPRSFSEEAASKYGWVQYQTGKSVTELEILYGVLNDPGMRGHGMFFFRDPAFIADVPESKRGDLMVEDQDSAEKLTSLKQAIRGAHLPFPPMENYPCRYAGLRINWRLASGDLEREADKETLRTIAEKGFVTPHAYTRLGSRVRQVVDSLGVVHLTDLEVFGRRVSEQLWQAIQYEHRLPDAPLTVAETDPLAEEAAYHEQFIESRVRMYVGRQDMQKQLTTFADGDATCPCLVTGRSGSGKSAALARFVRSYAESHPDVLVIPHFVGASPGSTSLRQMLRRFGLVLQDRFGLAEVVPDDVNELVSRFRQTLADMPAGFPMIVVVDALNQLNGDDRAQSMHWLPWELPPHVKVIVSCIDDSPEDEVPKEPVLQALAQRPLERIRIQPLTDDERLEIIGRVPTLSAKKLDPRQIGLLLKNSATKNPLFLLVALEELRGFGSFEQVGTRIAEFPSEGDTVVALFGQVIERLHEDFDPEIVRMLLASLACSRHGLSQRELLELIEGTGVEESTTDVFPVLRQLRPYLQRRGELIDFFHLGLSKAAQERYLSDEESLPAYHAELADYFYRKLSPPEGDPWSASYPRSLSELPYHQTRGQQWTALESTLTAIPFLEAKTLAGLVFDLAGDFSAAGDALPDDCPQRLLLHVLEQALRRDIHFIARHAQDFPEALFQSLWNACCWYGCPEAVHHYPSACSPEDLKPWHLNALDAYFPPRVPIYDMAMVLPWRRQHQIGPRLYEVLTSWGSAKRRAMRRLPWLRSHRPPPFHLGTAELLVLRGHEAPVTAVAYSTNGQRIASGSLDNTVRIWDANSAEELAILYGHEAPVNGVAFSTDGQKVVSGASDKTVRIWEVENGTEVAVLHGHEAPINAVAFSTDAQKIVSGSSDKTVRIWEVENGSEVAVLHGHEAAINAVAFSIEGQRIASGSDDMMVRLWDAKDGTRLAVLQAQRRVMSIAYSQDGQRIVAGLSDNTARFWETKTGLELGVWRGSSQTATGFAFSSDLGCIASASENWRVHLWVPVVGSPAAALGSDQEYGALQVLSDLFTVALGGLWALPVLGRLLGFRPNLQTVVLSVAFSPDGRRVAKGLQDNTVRVFDVESSEELVSFREHKDYVWSVTYSPDGRRIASGSADRTVRVWDAEDGLELITLRGHASAVCGVAFSPDGLRIVTGAVDRTVRIWDVETRAEVKVSKGHEAPVRSVAFSPDGQRIATGSADNTVRLWDAETGAELAVLRGHTSEVWSVAFSPDGRRIASGAFDNTVRIWDPYSGVEVAIPRRHEGQVTSVAFSPNGHWIATGSYDNKVRLWKTESSDDPCVLLGHSDCIWSISFSPDSRRVASGSSDGNVRIWNVEISSDLNCLDGHDGRVNGIAFSPGGQRIATASDDRTVRVWSVKNRAILTRLRGHMDVITSIAFSPDGCLVATGSKDTTVRVWDMDSGEELAVLSGRGFLVSSVALNSDGRLVAKGFDDGVLVVSDAEKEATLGAMHRHEDAVDCVAFSPDGHRIASGSEDKTVRVWDTASGELIGVLRGHTQPVRSVSFSPDGQWIVSGSEDRSVRLWDVATGAALRLLLGHIDRVSSVAFSPDGRTIASGSDDRTIRVWNLENGSESAVLRGHAHSVNVVAFSPDGRHIASGSEDRTVRFWEAKTAMQLRVLQGHKDEIRSVAFSPDGRCIASGSTDGTVRIWVAETGAVRARLQYGFPVSSVVFSPDGEIASLSEDGTWSVRDAASGVGRDASHGDDGTVTCVAFSPDDQRIAGGYGDATARLWDLETGLEMAVLRGHDAGITALVFSPDARHIVTASDDGTMRMWDANSGAEVVSLHGHEGGVTSVAFSLDGRRILSGGADKSVRVWDTASGEQLAVLRGHEHGVSSVSFLPDSRRIASGDGSFVRIWDSRTLECLQAIEGSGDASALACGPMERSVRAFARRQETLFEEAASGRVVARLPTALQPIAALDSRSTWAGGAGDYLCIVTLEDASPASVTTTDVPRFDFDPENAEGESAILDAVTPNDVVVISADAPRQDVPHSTLSDKSHMTSPLDASEDTIQRAWRAAVISFLVFLSPLSPTPRDIVQWPAFVIPFCILFCPYSIWLLLCLHPSQDSLSGAGLWKYRMAWSLNLLMVVFLLLILSAY